MVLSLEHKNIVQAIHLQSGFIFTVTLTYSHYMIRENK